MVSLETKLAWQKDDSMIMTLLRDFSGEMMKMIKRNSPGQLDFETD